MEENKALLLQILQGGFEHLEWWSEVRRRIAMRASGAFNASA
jgi:hypothetical protein